MPIYESVISGPHHRAVSHSLQGLRDIWGALEIARDHGRLPPDFAIGEWGRMVVPGDVIVDIIQGEPRYRQLHLELTMQSPGESGMRPAGIDEWCATTPPGSLFDVDLMGD